MKRYSITSYTYESIFGLDSGIEVEEESDGEWVKFSELDGGWNPISEKPGIFGNYLVCFQEDGSTKIGWGFLNSVGEWFVDQTLIFPTHWMSLPKAPK